MNRRRQTHVLAIALTAYLIAPAVSAQSEKASARMIPQPGHSVRMAMTQEMDFDFAFDAPGAAGLPSMKLQMRATMALTQKTGPRKADGSLDAELTYDEFRAETSMNGQAMSVESGDQFIGKTVTVTYGLDGQIVSVKGLPAGGLTDVAFKEIRPASIRFGEYNGERKDHPQHKCTGDVASAHDRTRHDQDDDDGEVSVRVCACRAATAT